MVQSLAPPARGVQIDAQIGPQLVLSDKFFQAARAHAFVYASEPFPERRPLVVVFRHQTFPLASVLSAARKAPVTSRSGSSSKIFFTMGAHASSL